MPAERKKSFRCAIYTRKSSEEGLEQAFNSLDAQREACAAYIESQRHEGWKLLDAQYDDGGYSGGTLERPALTRLLEDIGAGKVDVVVVYKVDRLTRSLGDFAKIVEQFDAHGVSFVSITQQFNTTSSMGRLTLNILLSFAQFEREVTGERIRDKIAASKRKGMWMGGRVPLGYDLKDRKLIVNKAEAALVSRIFSRYVELGCVAKLKAELDAKGVTSKIRVSKGGRRSGGRPYSRGALYDILQNRIYLGEIPHRGQSYPGEHAATIPNDLWDRIQTLLRTNNQARRNGLKAAAPSLLAGMLYDDRGNRLTPSHAVKKGKRYRYYVSQALIQGRPDRRGAAARIPAHDIETLVGRRLCAFLGSAREVRNAVGLPADDAATQRALITAAKTRATGWTKAAPVEARAFLRCIVLRITLGEGSAEIVFNKQGLRAALLGMGQPLEPSRDRHQEMTEEDNVIHLTFDAQIKRCGGEVRLIVPGAASGDTPARPSAPLIKAIARAHSWYEQLLSGSATQYSIAKQNSVNDTYVNRIIRCAFLAPDIIESILEGRQPVDLTLDKLINNLPIHWDGQRRVLGFANTGVIAS